MNQTSFPQLHTSRLVLRELDLLDAPSIFALRSDDQVNAYIDRPKARSLADAEEFIRKVRAGWGQDLQFYWAISLDEGPALVGTVCLWQFDPERTQAEIGYELLPLFQGRGLMHEAVAEVLRYGFEELGLRVITAITHRENTPSRQLLERLGFETDTANLFGQPEDPQEVLYFLRKE